MIDTDKYEGHTEGEWVFKHINSNWYQCDKIGEIHMEDIAIKEASANAQLIADAPLLLEEVKRLREENDELHAQRVQISWIQEARGGQSNAFELLAEVKRLRKLEAAVVGSWMRACDHRGPWHKALRYPCVELGYLTLDGHYFELSEEYQDMAKEWVREYDGDEEE